MLKQRKFLSAFGPRMRRKHDDDDNNVVDGESKERERRRGNFFDAIKQLIDIKHL